MAKRIQRKRMKDWRMPENAVYVGRPSKWGNPFRAHRDEHGCWSVAFCELPIFIPKHSEDDARAGAVRLFRAYMANDGSQVGAIRDCGGWFLNQLALDELRGKDLACWCPLDKPCHADVLLELANRQVTTTPTSEATQ